jgi:hypothetical protein
MTSDQLDTSIGKELVIPEPCFPALPFPKILKKDIRRLYSNMFANVSNSCDMNMTEGFFRDYSVHDMKFIQHCGIKPPFPNMPSFFQFDGLAVFLQFWFNRMHLAPDMCFRMKDSRIISFATTDESRVECDFELNGTRLLDVPFDMIIPSMEEQERILATAHLKRNTKIIKKRKLTADAAVISVSINNDDVVTQSSSTANKKRDDVGQVPIPFPLVMGDIISSHDRYDTTVCQRIQMAPLLTHPTSLCVRGTITMFLDCNKAIKTLQFQAASELVLMLDKDSLKAI